MPTPWGLLLGFITSAHNRVGISELIEALNMTKLMITIVAIALLSGCATDSAQRILSADRATYRNVGMSPALGSISVVDVGEMVAEQFANDVYIDAKIVDSFDGKYFLGNVNVPAGEKLRVVEAADGSLQFCSTRNLYSDPLTGPYDIVCFADTDDDLSFEKMRVPAIWGGRWEIVESSVSYQREIVDMPVGIATGYKTELIFRGLSDGDIKIEYHEYVNNMAQPSFSQTVDYKYSVGEATIALKGARIKVHDATSNNLTYTLDKGFDSYAKRDKDLSVGEEQFVGEESALIFGLGREGFFNSWNNCAVGRIVPPDLSTSIFDEPRRSRVIRDDSLVVAAGPVEILALCTWEDLFLEAQLPNAWFNFDAEAGHTYTFALSKRGECLNLLDATSDGQIIACEPFFSGRYVDLSTGDDKAIVRTVRASSNKGDCYRLDTAGLRGSSAGFLLVDAGPITVDVTCRAYVIGQMTLSFDFVAETGHVYTFSDSDKKCTRLLDITSQETEIACEPYKKDE